MRRRLPLLVAVAALGIVAVVVLSGALGSARRTETGLVTRVDGRSLTAVDGFALRTADGRVFEFRIGRLELETGSFPAGHLREHLVLSQPVVVAYREEDGVLVAVRLEDAPAGSASPS